MSHTGDLPTTANLNSSREKHDADDNVIQRRYYGGDGKAIINIDFDHDHGAGKPHAHDWDWSTDPPIRLPGRRLTASEKKKQK